MDILQETMEVQFTEEIQELAEELEYKPVEIYEYIRNNFKYEPYFGSLKGAQETLFEKAGNDFDLASLLIALLRVSGIKSRYVYGEIIVPIDAVMSWLGVHDPWVSGNILATNGIPAVMQTVGGKPYSIRMKHCWVEAYIPWMGGKVYRGAYNTKDIGNAKWMWVPMDVSFKEHLFFERIDVSNVPFNEDEYLDTLRESPFDFYFNLIQRYMEESYPDTSIAYGFYGSPIKSVYLGYIPGTLPYQVKKDGVNRFTEIPDSYRHKVRFETTGEYGMTDISYTISFPELAGKSVSLFYTPATASDEATIESYGGLYKTPAYLIKLKPQLRINNEIKTTGDAIGFGENQKFSMSFISPAFGEMDKVCNQVTSGAWYGISFNLQKIPGELRLLHSDRLITLLNSLDLSDTTEVIEPEPFWAEEFLYLIGIEYFSELDVTSELIRSFLRITSTREPSEVITGFDVSITTILGLPFGVSLSGMLIDADRNLEKVFSIYGDKTKEIKYTKITGYESSYLEHFIFEHWMDLPSVSAVKALQIASLNGIPIYDIDKSNIDNILPNLNIPEDAKVDIMNAVNRGLIAKVSESSVTLEDWRGVGYIITDPTTGSGSYLISGGYNGGSSTKEGRVLYSKIGRVITSVERGAAICVGYFRSEEAEWEALMESFLYSWLYLKLIAMQYTPYPLRTNTKKSFTNALQRDKYKIFYFTGHADYQNKELGLSKEISLPLNEIPSIPSGQYKLIYIASCGSANFLGSLDHPDGGFLNYFSAECKAGYIGRGSLSIDAAESIRYTIAFFTLLYGKLTASEAISLMRSWSGYWYFPFQLYIIGNTNLYED